MRKEIFFPLLLAAFISALVLSLCSASLVFAESTTGVEEKLDKARERRSELIDRQKEKRENFQEKKQDIYEKIATRQAEVKQHVVEKIKNVFSKILRRFNAALKRLDKIAQRIATRIDKLKARGVDTSSAEAALLASEIKGELRGTPAALIIMSRL